MSTGIAKLHFYLGFSSLLFEFGSVRLQVWDGTMIKPALTCSGVNILMFDPVLEPVHVLCCKTGLG